MKQQDDFSRLKHINEACQESLEFIKDKTIDDLKNNKMLSLALIKELEIIGEAANHISSEIKTRYSYIFWKDMIGMRNRLVHVYFGINYDIVWQTVTESLPVLQRQINEIMKQEFQEK